MNWRVSYRADRQIAQLADRHYNRQSIGSDQFVPPGRCLVLRTDDAGAFWITSWPFAQYVQHRWAGAWVCSAFRREAGPRASDLIREAVAITRWYWPLVPELGMVTFIDPDELDSAGREDQLAGYCFRRAGFRHVGETKGGLPCLQLLERRMPPPRPPLGALPFEADSMGHELASRVGV